MVGSLIIGDFTRNTHYTLGNIEYYETYNISIEQGYDSEDSVFNGHLYLLNTPEFKRVNRSQYGNGCDFTHEIMENRGRNCSIPTKRYCFIKCNNFLTG